MGKYRKIDPKIWNDEKFRSLSNRGKLIFLFCLTHPHMTPLGAMRATIPGLAAELGWEVEAFREGFREALNKDMLKADEGASFLWLPNFIKYNRPESPNVITSWVGSWDDIPECPLKSILLQQVKAFTKGFKEGFREAFNDAFKEALAKPMPKTILKTMPNQEQEQEQEQKYKISNSANVDTSTSQPEFDPVELDLVVKAIRLMASTSAVFQMALTRNGDLHKKMMDWARECSGLRWIMFCVGNLWSHVEAGNDGLNDPFEAAQPKAIGEPINYLYSLVFPRKSDRLPTFHIGENNFDDRHKVYWWYRTFGFDKLEQTNG